MLYHTRKGKIEPMEKRHIHRLRRVEEVKTIAEASQRMIILTRALVSWLEDTERKSNKLAGRDLILARLFNRKQLSNAANHLERAAEDLEQA